MDAVWVKLISTDPRYRTLVRRRSRLAWLMTSIMLIIYFGYILLVAFRRDILAAPIDDGVMSLGIPVGLGVILAGVGMTAIYVYIANRYFDPLLDDLRKEFGA